MRKSIVAAGVVSAFALFVGAAEADPLNIVFTHHSSASNPFWQAVKKGFDDACGKI
jgi:simple sugar transport system substrate-binding protein